MTEKRAQKSKSPGGRTPLTPCEDQGNLWPSADPPGPGPSDGDTQGAISVVGGETPSQPESSSGARGEKTAIQDLLFPDGLLAASLSLETATLDELQEKLEANLKQNSSETRRRYAQSIVHWFFSDGLDGLARKVWSAYHDERIESDILRQLYLSSEPIMGACVADALFPLQDGIVIPPEYFDRFLRNYLNAEPPAKTRKRVKMNLVKLGFLSPAQRGGHRLNPITPTKTAFLLLLHHLFAPVQPRTIELRHLFANPFWKYLGFKSQDSVRGVIREANASGLLAKYVVADELEQITSCFSLADILARGLRL